MIETALIIAAGRGIRMGPLGSVRPKGFIEVGGEALITRSFNLLLSKGIKRIVVVTGHLADAYDSLADHYGGRVECFFNEYFSSTGSFESLRVGVQQIGDPFLLLESDIIYQPAALDVVIESELENILLVSGPTGAGDEVYVWSRPASPHSTLHLLSKDCRASLEKPLGEMVGILRIGNELRSLIEEKALQCRPDDPARNYESGLVDLAQSVPIYCMKLADLIWAEIDDERMLEHVRANVYPRLTAQR